MKKNLILPIVFSIIFLMIILPNVSAFCRVDGYTKNLSLSFVGSFVQGRCENTNEIINFTKPAGELWLFSFGGIFDSCDGYCGNVWINGTNSTLNINGVADAGYPMNSSNVPGWNTGNTHESNITLHGDITPPVITINVPILNHYYNTQAITYDVTTDEDALDCEFSRDGAANISMASISETHFTYLQNSIPEGSHTFQVWCDDTSGNWGTAGPRTFYVDVTPPLATFGTNPPDGYLSPSPDIRFDEKCSDNLGLASLQVWGNWSGPWGPRFTLSTPTNDTFYNLTITSIPDGTWKWAAYCIDNAAWTDFTNTNRTFTVNSATFSISLTSPLLNHYYNVPGIWFNVTANQNADWCGYSLDGTANVTMSGSGMSWYNLSNIAEGPHSVVAYCNNSVGTYDSDGPRTFYVDLTNPIAFTNNPVNNSNWTSSQTVTFNLKCTDNLAVNTLVLYGNWSGAWQVEQTNPSPTNNTWWNPTEVIPNGVYQWAAWCNDSSGRTNITENITFTVNYHSGGGGGGGGGGSNCAGTCMDSCTDKYVAGNGSCSGNKVCCQLNVCKVCLSFIMQNSMLNFAVVDLDNLYSSISNETNITKDQLEYDIKNYNSVCGNYCIVFGNWFGAQLLEKISRSISKDYACTVAIIIVIALAILIIVLARKYVFKKKNRFYRR